MEKIVYKALKADLHIHSIYSKYKDDLGIVGNCSEDDLSILVNKLNESGVNLAAITDHDYFSYSMYEKFKSFEGTGSLIKVLPGIEFSVGIKNDENATKCIHIIAIFDDADSIKLKRIETDILKLNNDMIDYYNEGNLYYTEEKFISILNQIGLNVILIAHQKGSVNSSTVQDNDLNSLGVNTFNEYLASEVFDALEFKSMKNGLFNNLFAIERNKNYEIVRFITGSDCHTWSVYPKHDLLSVDNNYKHTFLKCLPTFRGVCMAITDYSRISLSSSLFSTDERKLKSIDLDINGNNYNIPLSNGINAIIGDNSIGKSLLLHKITNYEYLDDENIKKGYKQYLNDKNIKINNSISPSMIYKFDGQGNIRKRFETNNETDNQVFLQEKFPIEPSKDEYLRIINEQFNNLYSCLENKFQYDNEYKKLITLLMINDSIKRKNISVNKLSFNRKKYDGFVRIDTYLNKIINSIDDPNVQVNNGLMIDDVTKINEFKNFLLNIKKKYNQLSKEEKKIYNVKTGLNSGIDDFSTEMKNYKDALENAKDSFESNCDEVADTISKLLIYKSNIKSFEFNIISDINVDISELRYGEYNFVRRFKNVKTINNEYLDSILRRAFVSRFKLDSTSITEKELLDAIKNDNKIPDLKPLEILKSKINNVISDDFSVESHILKADQDVYSTLSNGMNSTIYFDIISNDNQSNGIYFIDQPEDDVSQTSIKTNLINDFKKMSLRRQIILITHNPQFVVNLDVDNVVCLSKDNYGEIVINSGALEFQDDNTSILNIVAENLDGGIESIKKRWKRYGKNIEFNKRR